MDQLLSELKKLNLPQKEYAIFGSGPLAIRKIREINDLDIIVKPELWKKLAAQYPAEDDQVIHLMLIEIFKDWRPWFKDVHQLIDSAEIIHHFPFVKLEYILKWKKMMNRKKDQKDILLIEKFLKKN